MKTVYLTGHRNFNNRGCEAIVRSTIKLLKQHDKALKFIVPSNNINEDIKQWPEAKNNGVIFVKFKIPIFLKILWKLQKFLHLSKFDILNYYPKSLLKIYEKVDFFLSIGGDNYSLDYTYPADIIYQDKLALKMKKPVILWGASVGTFEKMPHLIPKIKKHLSKIKLIYVREEISFKYLTRELGLENVKLSCDPAFTLQQQKTKEVDSVIKNLKRKNFIGINLSKLVFRYMKNEMHIVKEIKELVNDINNIYNMSVILIPHVWNYQKYESNDDFRFLNKIYKNCINSKLDILIAPHNLNAAQIKYLISFCKIFIGARTHSTIAALSLNIPTISISYSIKSEGLNKMIFGNTDLVINCDQLNKNNLIIKINELIKNEKNLNQTLATKNKYIQKVLTKSSFDLYNQIIKNQIKS